jgi:hypothetical protein
VIRLKFIIVLAMAILFAQLQCVAGCAGEPCHDDRSQTDSVPPCHQHHDHTHGHGSGPCTQHVLISPASLSQSVEIGLANFSIAELTPSAYALVPSNWRLFADGAFESSPPPLHSSSITVLRI